ncbi:hypothetical protein AGDE_02432 [Angomonas deanei]|uniref:EF-hand domain-containing protein n=1 Tax=Angomonas deanei TaxID=59799 RepID=S9VFC9_9TRYP|nr:hypothetical protein AGDE_09883 [Angomonas deanei]EPY40906.1 hypothetical protein AGDE_03020 [Angomonas deanei]EPY41492.1 hypothetical protein AGDE_02432 [Angomonas deanei]CAD2214243.1 hypothetical protein, conserved [Angomonas deanei]|eukprot:EPY29728.1 hypothetical protein AGDE_09883 [Angomonas deanei]
MDAQATREDQVDDTKDYIKKHKLNELFAHFLQLLLYNQPSDPRAFLCNEIRSIRDKKESTSLFNEQDLETMFDLIDVTKQRWVTVAQLRNTCRNLSASVSGEAEDTASNQVLQEAINAAGDEQGHVSLENFKEVLAMMLLTKNMWSE